MSDPPPPPGGRPPLPRPDTHPQLWDRRLVAHHHVPQPRNPRPMSGGPGGLPGFGHQPAPQGGGGPGFYVRNGIYVPLQYTDPGNPLMGGYGFGDWTDNGVTPHPGVDLNSGSSCNSDEAAEVVASADGVVVAVLPWDGRTSGEGNHLWVYYDDPRCIAPAWAHFDHLWAFGPLQEGERFTAGELLGYCGRTGNWDCAHAHCELARAQPSSWWQWPYAWTLAQVQAAYFDPGLWYSQTADKAGGMGGEVPMDTTAAERAALKPYFDLYGQDCNMDTALMKRACLAYKRDESPGPALSGEYPHGPYTRQQFTGRVAEWHPDDGLVYWVEVIKEQGG